MTRCRALLPALAALTIAACAEDVASPIHPTTPSLSLSQSESGDGSGTYIVRFSGSSVPSGFAASVAALGGSVVFAHGNAGVAAVSGLDDDRAAQLAASSGIAGVDADAVTYLDDPTGIEVESVDAPESPSNPAAALRFARQWHMRAIDAQTAWAAGKRGSASVQVAIIDTGIDYLHPDTYGKVDLTLSRSFLSAAEDARVQTAFPGAHPVADLHYHGTHVASTVVANGLITAGVTSGPTLVGLKVCTPGTTANGFRASCPTSGVLNAILYAADNGIEIANMSLGGTFSRRDASAKDGFGPSFIATIQQVMNYAARGGLTVVVSAGNDNADMDHDKNSFKAYCSAASVICVSATGPTTAGSLLSTGFYSNLTNIDARAPYSNYGVSAVTVAAPGGAAAPVWASCSGFTIVTSLLACRGRSYNPATGAFSGFIVGINGTSMASPHAAGVAALIASNGIVGAAQIGAKLRQSADDLGLPEADPVYGHGRVNAARAAGAIQ